MLVDDYTVSNENYEVVMLKETRNIFCVMYHFPATNLSIVLQYFESLMEFIIVSWFELFLCNHFNIDMLKDSVESRKFSTALKSSGFVNTVTTPTRVSSRSFTLLDLFITNMELENVQTGIVLTDIREL